jgi:hypothetical protein
MNSKNKIILDLGLLLSGGPRVITFQDISVDILHHDPSIVSVIIYRVKLLESEID